jgi:glycosyltransferase involved in cell wall biosynthesis
MNHVLEVVGDGTPGGGTTAVLSLSLQLVRRGFAVTVASQRDSYIVHEARRNGISVLELGFERRRSIVSPATALSRYIKDGGISVTHAHGARAGLPISLLPKARRGRFVYTVHGFHYPRKPIGIRHLARRAECLCISRSQMTVFVCHHDRRLAVSDDLLPSDHASTIIYNGSAAFELPSGVASSERFDLAYLGRLHHQKNPLIIPEILLGLRPIRPTMAIIGGGECERDLRARIAQAGLNDQVTFFGECSHDRGLALLSRARIMLLPSLSEGMPLSVIEAMHFGIPTVASRVGGLVESIDDCSTGYLIEPSDLTGFVARLRNLILDQDLCQSMGIRARERAKEMFLMERNISEHIAVYKQVLARKPDWSAVGAAA